MTALNRLTKPPSPRGSSVSANGSSRLVRIAPIQILPPGRPFDVIKLVVFTGILAIVGWSARLGLLPRTRPIVPGELAVSD